MDILSILRLLQMGGMILAAIAALVFLIMYSRSWDLHNIFARFIITLNSLFVLIIGFGLVNRFFPTTYVIEIIKSILYLAMGILMSSQLYLLWGIRRKSQTMHKTPSE